MTELKTIPQILSTQTVGVPDWAVGLLVLVAQGMVIQSVMQLSPTTEPAAPAAPDPVTLKDMAMLFTEMKKIHDYSYKLFDFLLIWAPRYQTR